MFILWYYRHQSLLTSLNFCSQSSSRPFNWHVFTAFKNVVAHVTQLSHFWACSPESASNRAACILRHITALLIKTEVWSPPRCSPDRQMKKLGCPYAADFLKHEKEWSGAICRKIGAGIKEREISHQHEDKYCVFSLMCGVSGKNKGHKSKWGLSRCGKENTRERGIKISN